MAKTVSFKTILARAEKRKGGPAGLKKLLPVKPNAKALEKHNQVKLIERDLRRARKVSELLENTIVLNGDAADEDQAGRSIRAR